MKLKKHEREAIYTAVERIENNIEIFSCIAMERIGIKHLIPAYREFFDQTDDMFTVFITPDGECMYYGDKEWRIMCLLLFAEVCK